MSDLLIGLIVLGSALVSLRKPWIGAIVSIWISLMSPHIEFGWRAREWPVATVVFLGMFIGLLGTKDRQSPFLGAPVWFLLAFWIWCVVGFPFSFSVDASTAMLSKVSKIYLLVFVTLALVNTQRKLDWMVLTLVVSLAFYGVKGGVFTILTGGNHRVWGPANSFIEGNNELALALIATMPLVQYLNMRMTNKWARYAALAALLLLPLSVLGSHSRGGLVGLACMAIFLWWKGENKLFRGALMIVVGAVALSLMPEHWWARMNTIDSYEMDTSAQGRINAWWNAFNVAKATIFGGGFQIYNAEVFARFAPDPTKIHAAHSIYFQVLGEHGFIGLGLFLGIGASTWLVCGRIIREVRGHAELKWASQLAAMLQVSMVGLASAGAFLSLAYFDLLYYEMAIAVITRRVVQSHIKSRSNTAESASMTTTLPTMTRQPRP